MDAEQLRDTIEKEGAGTAEKPPVRTHKSNARQGIAPNQVRYMLIIGVVAVVIGFIAAYLLVA